MNISFTVLKEFEGFTGLKLNVQNQKHYKYVLKENKKIVPLSL